MEDHIIKADPDRAQEEALQHDLRPFIHPRNHAEEIANILAERDAMRECELRYRIYFELES